MRVEEEEMEGWRNKESGRRRWTGWMRNESRRRGRNNESRRMRWGGGGGGGGIMRVGEGGRVGVMKMGARRGGGERELEKEE